MEERQTIRKTWANRTMMTGDTIGDEDRYMRCRGWRVEQSSSVVFVGIQGWKVLKSVGKSGFGSGHPELLFFSKQR